MRATLIAPVLVVALPLWLSACGAALSPPPEYSWVFDVTVTPSDSECVDVGDASEESYVYGIVVEGDVVSIYSDDSKLADGTLTGKYIAYQSPAPFTERRTGSAGEPLEIEWTLAGNVLFNDNELTTSQEGEEVITVFQSEVEDVETGCSHTSTTVWERR